jgi:hypothetical protein
MPDIADWPHFIIQSLSDGIITVDGQLQVTDLNRAGTAHGAFPGAGPGETLRRSAAEQFVRQGMSLENRHELR